MLVTMFVNDSSSDLKNLYVNHANIHNQKLLNNIDFMDAGFDLFVPYNLEKANVLGTTRFEWNRVNKLDLKVKVAAQMCLLSNGSSSSCAKVCDIEDFCSEAACDKTTGSYNTGFYLYPRSSISKTCLRMANSTGIIDSGYRGNLIAMMDVVYEEEYFVNAYDKLVQICAPGLVPVVVNVVDTEEELGEKTARGEGGFGSTSTFIKR
jgi:hypothetical protein